MVDMIMKDVHGGVILYLLHRKNYEERNTT